MSDELKVEYTVKEIVQLIGKKIDKLDEKFDQYMDVSNKRFEAIEQNQIGMTKIGEYKAQLDTNQSRVRLSLWGIAVTAAVALIDLVSRYVHK